MAIDKNLEKLAKMPEVEKAYIDASGRHLKVKTDKAVLTISAIKYTSEEVFEVSMPIVPSHEAGSAIGISEPHFHFNLAETMKAIKEAKAIIPNWYTPKQKEVIKFQTIKEAVNQHGNILGFTSI